MQISNGEKLQSCNVATCIFPSCLLTLLEAENTLVLKLCNVFRTYVRTDRWASWAAVAAKKNIENILP